MNDEVTIGELARLLADFKLTVDRIESKLDGLSDHFVPREVYQLERDESIRDRAALHIRLETVQSELSELRKDSFSKKAIYGWLGGMSALIVAASSLAAILLRK